MSKENKKLTDEQLFSFATSTNEEMEVTQGESLTFWKDAIIKFRKNKGAVAGMIMFLIILVGMITAPFISPYYNDVKTLASDASAAIKSNDLKALSEIPLNIDINNSDLDAAINNAVETSNDRISMGSFDNIKYALLPPKAPVLEKLGIMDGKHNGVDVYAKNGIPEGVYFPFGTDNLGRDNYVRVFRGAQLSLFIGLVAALLDIIIGLTIGGLSGYYGGKFDLFIQRFVDIISSIPTIIFLVLLSLYFSTSGKGPIGTALPIVLAIAITGWIGMNRIVRA
ncbi:MAG: ABC transporter permease, partial [Mycoplasmatales bacterium]